MDIDIGTIKIQNDNHRVSWSLGQYLELTHAHFCMFSWSTVLAPGFLSLLDPSLEVAASYLAEESSKECGAAHLDAKEELLLTFNTIC